AAGEQTSAYGYVCELVEAAARAAGSEQSGTWNLGTGVETSVNRLFEILARMFGYAETPPHVPNPPGEQRRSVLDGTLALRDFHLPPYTPIEEGLRVTAEWFRARAAASVSGS